MEVLYIRIELWPHGNERQSVLLHEGVIANDGSGSKSSGNYNYSFGRRASDLKLGKYDGHIEGFKRISQTAWRLLHDCLQDYFRNK